MTLRDNVIRDVVVVLPGIMGSELVHSDGEPVWSTTPRFLTHSLATLGRRLDDLRLPANHGDAPAPNGVHASRLLPDLVAIPGLWRPVSGYSQLNDFLRGPRFNFIEADPARPERIPNLIEFPYDWRLSNRHNGRRLAEVALPALERWQSQPGMHEAELVIVAHSMGGLVARWFLECEGGAEHTRALITVATPHRGALSALTTLVNGLRPGFGPFRLNLSRFASSLPALYQLLPQYRCVAADGGRLGVTDANLAAPRPAQISDAADFHTRIEQTRGGYTLHKVVGIRQPTHTTCRVEDGRIVPITTIDGREQGGDGTVPVNAAVPTFDRESEVVTVVGQHGELQHARAVCDLIDGVVTRRDIVWESTRSVRPLGVVMDDAHIVGVPAEVQITEIENRRLWVRILDCAGTQVGRPIPVRADGRAALPDLAPGDYRVEVYGAIRGMAPTVAHPFAVWVPDDPREDA